MHTRMTRTHPSSTAEAIVAFWTPPACREEVLGDLHERYRSPFQYAVEALHTTPAVVFSQIRRYTGPQLLLLQACTIYLSYLAAAWLIDRSLFQTEYGFLRLAIPAAGVLLIALLDTVYGNPKQTIRSKRPVMLALSATMCVVITVMPHPGHPFLHVVLLGWFISVVLLLAVQTFVDVHRWWNSI
jgi:hypothetical protein